MCASRSFALQLFKQKKYREIQKQTHRTTVKSLALLIVIAAAAQIVTPCCVLSLFLPRYTMYVLMDFLNLTAAVLLSPSSH